MLIKILSVSYRHNVNEKRQGNLEQKHKVKTEPAKRTSIETFHWVMSET